MNQCFKRRDDDTGTSNIIFSCAKLFANDAVLSRVRRNDDSCVVSSYLFRALAIFFSLAFLQIFLTLLVFCYGTPFVTKIAHIGRTPSKFERTPSSLKGLLQVCKDSCKLPGTPASLQNPQASRNSCGLAGTPASFQELLYNAHDYFKAKVMH